MTYLRLMCILILYMIPTTDNVKTITDMREDALALLQEVNKTKGPFYIFHRSKPKAVLIAIKQYIKLHELLEDYFDSLSAQEYEKIDKTKVKWQTLEDLKKELSL